jgi:hypothetical protein
MKTYVFPIGIARGQFTFEIEYGKSCTFVNNTNEEKQPILTNSTDPLDSLSH